MKIKEIIEMSTDELLTKKRDLRQESLHLRLQQQSGQLEQTSRLRLLRREAARIATGGPGGTTPAGWVCSDARWPGSRRCFPNGRRRRNNFYGRRTINLGATAAAGKRPVICCNRTTISARFA